ncbi:MAG: porin family protein [Pseudomonadota bacterium]|nr:porin family protein [Pseudomonadota bacterium]
MRRQILLASVGAIAIAGSAFAADLPYRGPPPVYLPPPPIFTWTGLYLGGQVGYAWGNDPIDVVDVVFGDNAFFNDKPNGVIGGAHLGYNLQIAQWVAGLEGSVDGTSLHGTRTSATGVTMSTRPDVQGSIRARIGIAFDRVLIYGTGGAAFAGIHNNYSVGFLSESDSKTRTGWTVGGGLEYAVTNNWSIRAEYRYSDFGRSPDFPFSSLTLGNVSFTHHLKESQVQAGFSYKFNSWGPGPVVARY